MYRTNIHIVENVWKILLRKHVYSYIFICTLLTHKKQWHPNVSKELWECVIAHDGNYECTLSRSRNNTSMGTPAV